MTTGQTAMQDDTPDTEAETPHNAATEISTGKKAPGAFRTISEVADELGVQQHVLRFWETKFAQVKPLKRGGNRRYYRPEDVQLLQKIHNLLYIEGYTIKGVQKLLKTYGKAQLLADTRPQAAALKTGAAPTNQRVNQGANQAANQSPAANTQTANQPAAKSGEMKITDKQRSILQAMLGDLRDLRDMIAVDEK